MPIILIWIYLLDIILNYTISTVCFILLGLSYFAILLLKNWNKLQSENNLKKLKYANHH
ncbi:hypothetical protein SAMN05421857_3638 [Chryseobacterium formosense]|nr:hypothetical protein SAMN05421857_3638 [Chryseobacterium formosense]